MGFKFARRVPRLLRLLRLRNMTKAGKSTRRDYSLTTWMRRTDRLIDPEKVFLKCFAFDQSKVGFSPDLESTRLSQKLKWIQSMPIVRSAGVVAFAFEEEGNQR